MTPEQELDWQVMSSEWKAQPLPPHLRDVSRYIRRSRRRLYVGVGFDLAVLATVGVVTVLLAMRQPTPVVLLAGTVLLCVNAGIVGFSVTLRRRVLGVLLASPADLVGAMRAKGEAAVRAARFSFVVVFVQAAAVVGYVAAFTRDASQGSRSLATAALLAVALVSAQLIAARATRSAAQKALREADQIARMLHQEDLEAETSGTTV